MERKYHISQLTLEMYYRGLATFKERRQVEKALKTDIVIQNRYKEIQESCQEIRKSFSQEMIRLEAQRIPPVQVVHSINIVWVVIAATAILVCVLVPTFLYLKQNGQKTDNTIAEKIVKESTHETETPKETIITEKNPLKKKPSPEQPVRKEKESKSGSANLQSDNYIVSIIPDTDTELHSREGDDRQQNTATMSEQEDNSGIPPGITFISENMFANMFMVGIVIPDRIRSIAKNAYAGNPVLVVTIGANVDVHDEAIPGNFAKAYNSYGKAAGIYKRRSSDSEEWKKL